MMNRMMLRSAGGSVNLFQDATVGLSLRSLGINPNKNKIEAFRVANNDVDVFNANQIQNTNNLQSFGGASDLLVRTLYDETDNNYHASQTDEPKMPKIYDSASGNLILENGKPTISYDGIDDFLETTDMGIRNQPNTIFTVHKYDALGVNKPVFGGLSTGNRNQFFINNGNYLLFAGTARDTGIIANQNLELSTSLFNEANSIVHLNGVAGDVINPGSLYLKGFKLATEGVNYANIKISEFVYFDTDKSAERPQIEANINNFYNIY